MRSGHRTSPRPVKRAWLCIAVLLPVALVVSLLNNLSASWAVLAFIAILYGPVLWLTVLIHELGHCLATKQVRFPMAHEETMINLHAVHFGLRCAHCLTVLQLTPPKSASLHGCRLMLNSECLARV
jgi:hypothetical protein